jgi:hypothetical protein
MVGALDRDTQYRVTQHIFRPERLLWLHLGDA